TTDPVYTTAKPSGAFTVTTRIPRAKAAGTYPVNLRCGGSPVGGGTLVVQEAHSTLQVSPRSVVAGDSVTVSGSLPPAPGSECATGVTLLRPPHPPAPGGGGHRPRARPRGGGKRRPRGGRGRGARGGPDNQAGRH